MWNVLMNLLHVKRGEGGREGEPLPAPQLLCAAEQDAKFRRKFGLWKMIKDANVCSCPL